MAQLTTPPFPQKMTFREMCNGLFNTDFLSPEEFTTICDAAEMYANGCLKQERERAGKLMEALKEIRDNQFGVSWVHQIARIAITKYEK